jgi:hypothetical protein
MKPHWIASLCLALLASIAQAQGTSPPYELKASLAFARAAPDQYLMAHSITHNFIYPPQVYDLMTDSSDELGCG